MAAAQARDLSFLPTAQRPKRQGLSVMLTNALRSNCPLRFERTAQFTKRHEAVILPIGGAIEPGGRAPLATNQAGARKVQLGASHPLVAITPGDSFRRRMVRSTGMTAEIVQETGSERIEYRFQAPVHLLILFERGVRREGETVIVGLPGSSLRHASYSSVRSCTLAAHRRSSCRHQDRDERRCVVPGGRLVRFFWRP